MTGMSPTADLPFVSIVVSFHNDSSFLRKCVESMLDLAYPPEKFEIILVNDGSTDNSQETITDLLAAHPTKVRLLSQADRGPAAGRNLGIQNAGGEIVAFTDPDCVIDQGWLTHHVGNYTSEEVGGVEGRIETNWGQMLTPIRISPAGTRYVTANMSYRRDVLEKVGGFDERFRWKEDDDLAYMVMGAGWKIVSDHEAVVFHPVRELSVHALVAQAMKFRYDALFYRKHRKVARSYFGLIGLGPLELTPEFFLSCGAVGILVLVLAGFLSGSPLAILPLIAVGVLVIFQQHRAGKRKVKSSIPWMILFTMFVEVGRVWGAIKFRQFFL